MKREILFRGKGLFGKWVYGYLIITDGRWAIRTEHKEDDMGYGLYSVDEKTVGQFTGITDDQGIRIFEDDIRMDEHGKCYRVYAVPGGFAMKAWYWADDISDLVPTDDLILNSLSDPQTRAYITESTVRLGNIHDNPELITKKQ